MRFSVVYSCGGIYNLLCFLLVILLGFLGSTQAYGLSDSTPKVHFMTFATSIRRKELCVLAETIRRFSQQKFHLSVLGTTYTYGSICEPINNGRWPIASSGFKRLKNRRIQKLYDFRMCKLVWLDWFLRVRMFNATTSQRYSEDDIVVFTDAYDVMVLRDLSELLPIYLNYERTTKKSVVFGGDGFCWPLMNRHYKIRSPNTPRASVVCGYFATQGRGHIYKYLNSGTYMGRIRALQQFFDGVRTNFSQEQDDQAMLTLMAYANPSLAAVDYKALIFVGVPHQYKGAVRTTPYGRKNSTMLCEEDFFVDLPKFQFTGTRPLIFHFNGKPKRYFKECMASFLKTYPLTATTPIYDVDRDRVYRVKNVCYHAVEHGRNRSKVDRERKTELNKMQKIIYDLPRL